MTWIWLLIFLLFFSCRAGAAGAAWVASGADHRVVFTSNAALAFADSDWTISMWVLVTNNAGTGVEVILSRNSGGTGANPNVEVDCFEATRASDPGKLPAFVNDDDATDKPLIPTSATNCNTTGTWMHVLLKRESNALSLRVDNVQTSSQGADSALDAIAAADWYFFTRPDLTADFDGQLCDFGKWNRALTTDEMTALSQGFSANHFLRGLEVWAPAISEFQERVVPLTVTATGATATGKCPRIFYSH